jgi:hypothetical protein
MDMSASATGACLRDTVRTGLMPVACPMAFILVTITIVMAPVVFYLAAITPESMPSPIITSYFKMDIMIAARNIIDNAAIPGVMEIMPA